MAAKSLPEMPCGPILELHGQRKRLHVPFGLKSLIEHMARDILRDNPEDIYLYLADWMESRVQNKRLAEQLMTKVRRHSWDQYAWSWEASSVLTEEELMEFLQLFRMSQADANRYAITIQKAYRGFLARQRVKGIRKSREIEFETLMKPKFTEDSDKKSQQVLAGEIQASNMEFPGEGEYEGEGEDEEEVEWIPNEEEEEDEEEEEEEYDSSRTYEVDDELSHENGVPSDEHVRDVGMTDQEEEESLDGQDNPSHAHQEYYDEDEEEEMQNIKSYTSEKRQDELPPPPPSEEEESDGEDIEFIP